MKIVYTTQFKRDYQRVKRQHKDLSKLENVIRQLAAAGSLAPSHKDHPLIGGWKGYRDCHIESDWLLIYKKTADSLILTRTGSHSELFD